jgi:hypothetical protein
MTKILRGILFVPASIFTLVIAAPVFSSEVMKVERDYGRLPLVFVPNAGQVDGPVAYSIRGRDKSVHFSSSGLTVVLSDGPTERTRPVHPAMEAMGLSAGIPAGDVPPRPSLWVVKLDFLGADPAVRIEADEKTDTSFSFFRGARDNWKTGLPAFRKVIYRDLWPGIDLAYYGEGDFLKHEFIVHPGADPSLIRLAYRGAESVTVDEDGRLEVSTPFGNFADAAPIAWQDGAERRTDVSASFALETGGDADGEDRSRTFVYGFTLGDYDGNLPLVIDPAVIVACGFIGGSGSDYGYGIAVDTAGNAYIAGYTESTETSFPVAWGPATAYGGGIYDAFVARVNASGTGLDYCGFIGGAGDDRAYSIAVDGSGNAYVAGYTTSAADTFPVVNGPVLLHGGGGPDAFLAKVGASGLLEYCGYIGGAGDDRAFGVAVDGSGNAYVVGYTDSLADSFPKTVGPSLVNNGGYDAFVAKVNSAGTGFDYCGYIGGALWDYGLAVAVDGNRNAYVTGLTLSTESTFPVKVGPDLVYNGGYSDAFVAKVNVSGTGLDYCGYVGGADVESGFAVAVDTNGRAYITGLTLSSEATFPVKIGPDLVYNGGYSDAFVARVNAAGTELEYCGYIGGSTPGAMGSRPGGEQGTGIAVDTMGNAYVSGWTESTEATFPVKIGPGLVYGDAGDAFVAKVDSSGASLVYCGYIGGSGDDEALHVAVDASGNAYLVGFTGSTEATFPVAVGPFLEHGGGKDAFVAKISSFGLNVTTPNGGESWWRGFPNNIYWNASGFSGDVAIDLYKGGVFHSNIGTEDAGQGSFSWNIPAGLAIGEDYRVRITSVSTPEYRDESDGDFSITDMGHPPTLSVSRTALAFGATTTGQKTRTQRLVIRNTGGAVMEWTATDNAVWLSCTPSSGTNDGEVFVSVDVSGLPAGSYSATILVNAPEAVNNPQLVLVKLEIYPALGTSAPYGVFDTPVDGAVVAGAIPVTGWALDDIEVAKVEIKRSPHAADNPALIGPDGLVFISDAIFVEGARPDIETAYPGRPLNYQAGWGYMMLTNMLPNQGNGPFTIHAFAVDKEGARVKLGEKSISGNNAGSDLPFGTIDTPAQGGTVSGAAYLNFGWALTPQPNMIPVDGSTITVWVNGVLLDNPSYGHYREDIALLFPGLQNSDGAVGLYHLDSMGLANDVHTIAWGVVDDDGNADGIGSRYFTVFNTGGGAETAGAAGAGGDVSADDRLRSRRDFTKAKGAPASVGATLGIPMRAEAVGVRRGYAERGEARGAVPDEQGVVRLEIREVERIEVTLDPRMGGDFGARESGGWPGLDAGGASYAGFLAVGEELRPLPIGSTLDPRSGVFSWQPGPGFLGDYRFVFVRTASDGTLRQTPLLITIHPLF